MSEPLQVLEPGVYRVTREVLPLRPDKRMKYDWRAKPIEKSTVFLIRNDYSRVRDEEVVYLGLTARPVGSYLSEEIHITPEEHRVLWSSLERIAEPTAMQHLALKDRGNYAEELLNRLVKRFDVTHHELDEMCDQMDREYDAAEEAKKNQ